MHVAVLGNEGSWYCRDLQRAAEERGHRFSQIDFDTVVGRVGTQAGMLEGSGLDLTALDAVIVRTMPPGSLEQVVFRMDALARFESLGIVVLNPPRAIECAVDKYLATAKLAEANLPVPPTVVCENSECALSAFDELGGDVVVKPIFGSEGRGILRVHDRDLAWRTFRTLERLQSVLYLQKYIEHEGFDLRALVLDGEIIGSIRRRSTDDFRTNVSRNGTAEACSLNENERELAIHAAAAVGTRFAGVDLLYDRAGCCYVIEVNAVPGWKGFQAATGCDVAVKVIECLEQSVRQ